MSAQQIRCLLCGGRGGWWSGEFRETCSHCQGGGYEIDPSPLLVEICAPYQDYDGFTPEDAS